MQGNADSQNNVGQEPASSQRGTGENKPRLISGRRLRAVFLSIPNYSKAEWFSAAVIVLLVILLLSYLLNTDIRANADRVSIIISLFTTVPIFLFYFANKIKNWEEKLPKYLTVTFTYNNKPQVKFECIPLLGVSDIRQQAQTITQTIVGTNRFPLKPYVKKTPLGKVYKNEKENKYIMLYTIEQEMTCSLKRAKNIEKVPEQVIKSEKSNENYLEIYEPFDLSIKASYQFINLKD